MKPVNRDSDNADVPVDRRIISLRAYVTRKPKPDAKPAAEKKANPWWSKDRIAPQDWVLVFDCETRTTPDQQLRFGTFQLRYRGHIIERGAFYDPTLDETDLATLGREVANERPSADGERIVLLTRQEFVERVFFNSAYYIGAQIVGFNLPFDLSRLAIEHTHSKRSMKGGFSLILHPSKRYPRVRVRHLSPRSSLIQFTGTKPDKGGVSDDEAPDMEKREPDRGYFVDVKTFAAALLSESHSLESLCKTLDVATKKEPSDDHGEILKPEYVRYAFDDTQTTWECFDALSKKFASYGLTDTGAYDLYSEASLGKAYLKTMGVKPWREVQEDFSPLIIGNILSAYYGGRSEVHIRRQIVDVLHCDFLSMYPTVCTLMGLWEFVRATGVTDADDTNAVRALVANCTADDLKAPAQWRKLAVLVQVLPQNDLLPVRAAYGESETTTIGLNYLTADEPMWFTLADVLVSKILTGKTPHIVEATRFMPMEPQSDLHSVTVSGRLVDPVKDDFYKTLIDHRREIRTRADAAKQPEKDRLEGEQQGVKILANATSYGIFVELNVQKLSKSQEMISHGVYAKEWDCDSDDWEKPGRYFHPLLATLITGAARLMLSLAERQVIDQGLNWAFCDTDSLAIANLPRLATKEFERSALKVQDWFADLNPYAVKGSILQLEAVNFPPGKKGQLDYLTPPQCLAISAKRYVLFNHGADGNAVIRKASGHGLGYLMAPYDEPVEKRRERIKRIGVPLWQEDFWQEVIRAAQSKDPDQVPLDKMRGFTSPAASQYAATKPGTLSWFDAYNKGKHYADQVKPFNFLLSLYAKSRIQMALDDSAALAGPQWRRREPRPAAPYQKDARKAAEHAFDRDRPEQGVPVHWLKTVARALARYHLHPEEKFLGGDYDQRGILMRRHVHALAFQPIGKESDEIEEREVLGDDEEPIQWPFAAHAQTQLMKFVDNTKRECGLGERDLMKRAKVSHHTLGAAREGTPIDAVTLRRIAAATVALRDNFLRFKSEADELLDWARQVVIDVGGRNAFAKLVGVSGPYLGRVLSGEKALSEELLFRFRQLRELV